MAARYKERVGERIKAAREARQWSQARLARELPDTIDGASISRWETGKVEPRADNLQALADALGVDPSYFLAPEPVLGTGNLMDVLPGGTQLDRIETALRNIAERQTLIARAVGVSLPELEAGFADLARLAGDDPPKPS